MARTRTTLASDMLLELRRDDPVPLHRQIEREIRAGIHSGRFASGSALPSTRVLAEAFGLSRGVVVEAYEQLIAEGYLVSRHGGGTRVARRTPAAGPATVTRPTVEYRVDFAYGRADVTGFPRQAWMRSIRRVMIEAPSARLGYLEGRGAPELREALAVYLDRVRGTVGDARPDRHLQRLRPGAAPRARGVGRHRRAAARGRGPGASDTPAVARRHGLSVAAIPADEDGIVVDALARSDADAVVVTPAHQFPLGGVLPPSRREALLAWAEAGPRFILEDDYDAEFRFDREPIGAIQGLAPERVLYAGSASKVLAPGLRLGWLVAPDALVDRLAEAKEASDRGSAGIEQLAFADFLARGGFDHHLRRMRPIYRRRRDRLLAALARYLPSARPVGASAGLHLVAMLPDGIDEEAVVERRGRRRRPGRRLAAIPDQRTGRARRARVRLRRGPRGGHRRGRPDRRSGGRRGHVSGAIAVDRRSGAATPWLQAMGRGPTAARASGGQAGTTIDDAALLETIDPHLAERHTSTGRRDKPGRGPQWTGVRARGMPAAGDPIAVGHLILELDAEIGHRRSQKVRLLLDRVSADDGRRPRPMTDTTRRHDLVGGVDAPRAEDLHVEALRGGLHLFERERGPRIDDRHHSMPSSVLALSDRDDVPASAAALNLSSAAGHISARNARSSSRPSGRARNRRFVPTRRSETKPAARSTGDVGRWPAALRRNVWRSRQRPSPRLPRAGGSRVDWLGDRAQDRLGGSCGCSIRPTDRPAARRDRR